MDEKQKKMNLTDEQAEQAAGGANPYLEALAAPADGPAAETAANNRQQFLPGVLLHQVAPVTEGTVQFERRYPVKFYTGNSTNEKPPVDPRAI